MRKLFIFILTLATVLSLSIGAYAADLSVSAQTDDLRAGDTFTVTVKYSDEQLDSVRGSIEYDDDMLDYVSGGSNDGSGGVVKLDGYSDDAATITFEVQFEALKSGTASLKVETSECYNLDGQQLNSPWESISVDIAEIPDDEDDDQDKDDDPDVTPDDNDDDGDVDNPDDGNTPDPADDQRTNNTVMLIIGSAVTLVILFIVVKIVQASKRRRNR